MSDIPNWSVDDFINLMYFYLPSGDAWSREDLAILYAEISGLAPTHQRLATAATYSIQDTQPSNTISLIPEYQEVLGLPDPYFPTTTQAEEQAQITARFTATGGVSIPYFKSFVANLLGTTPDNITITVYAPFIMGYSLMGNPFNDWHTTFYWTITIPSEYSSMVPLVQYEVGREEPAYGGLTVIAS